MNGHFLSFLSTKTSLSVSNCWSADQTLTEGDVPTLHLYLRLFSHTHSLYQLDTRSAQKNTHWIRIQRWYVLYLVSFYKVELTWRQLSHLRECVSGLCVQWWREKINKLHGPQGRVVLLKHRGEQLFMLVELLQDLTSQKKRQPSLVCVEQLCISDSRRVIASKLIFQLFST